MSMKRRDPVARLAAAARRRFWLARAALLWERLWPALWPAAMILAAFVAASLFDLWALVPGAVHAGTLALAVIGAVATTARGLARLRLPTPVETLHRIERASRLSHRPLVALGDRPAGAETAGAADGRALKALWQAHLARSAERVRGLRAGFAAPGLARRDPWGLRAVMVLVLVIAASAAGADAPARIARGFTPDLTDFGGAGPAALTLWITPPKYTGVAPVFVTTASTGEVAVPLAAVAVPSGSTVLARVHGGRGRPELVIDDERVPFERVDEARFELRSTLVAGRRLAVEQNGREIGAWPLTVIADQPPRIEFARPPARTQRAALRLDYLAEDDYGLSKAEAIVRRVDRPGESFTLDLPLSAAGARRASETAFNDLTAHPWAGIDVTVTLKATDSIGQTGESAPIAIVLPARVFNHPVARALVALRRKLTLDPTARAEVGRALDEIASRPDHFFNDVSIFLGLRAARWRLVYDRSADAIAGVQSLLWDLALTIEDGPVALAEQALREAEQALLDALDRNATDEEINRLIDQLRKRLDDFLDALAAEAAKERDRDPGVAEQMMQTIRRDELHNVIERMREMFRTGARDAARALLSQLREVLENLRAQRMAGQDQASRSAGEAAIGDLQRLLGRQQNLLDKTFRWAQGGAQAGEPSPGAPADEGAAEQEAIRQGLGELMLKWGETGREIPRALGRAERAMRESGRALSDNRPGQAVAPQTRALDQLRAGAQAMMEALMKEGGQGGPDRPGGMGLFGGADPLGRGMLGRGLRSDGSDTRVPDEAEIQRSREILDELYRRAGEFTRPPVERRYIRRLLRRF